MQVVNDVEVIEGNDHTRVRHGGGRQPSDARLPLTSPPSQLNDSVSHTLLRGCLLLIQYLLRRVVDGRCGGVKHDRRTCEQIPVTFYRGGGGKSKTVDRGKEEIMEEGARDNMKGRRVWE